ATSGSDLVSQDHVHGQGYFPVSRRLEARVGSGRTRPHRQAHRSHQLPIGGRGSGRGPESESQRVDILGQDHVGRRVAVGTYHQITRAQHILVLPVSVNPVGDVQVHRGLHPYAVQALGIVLNAVFELIGGVGAADLDL